MKQKALTLGIVLIFLVSACAPRSTPTANPVDVQHTAEAAAFTMVAQTQEAIPTNTTVPPTEVASPTLPATLTAIALPTDASITAVAGLPTTSTNLTTLIPPTSAPPPASTDANCNKPLTAWQGPSASFSIFNETKPEGKIILSLYVVTDLGECGYLADISRGPVGQYSAGAFVEGKQDFKVFGGFRITEGSWKIVVKNDSITALGGCYPHC